MAFRIDLTLDCASPTKLAEFWKLALGYEDEPPPAPFASRQEWLGDGRSRRERVLRLLTLLS
jgi:hypothetical protein